MKHKVGDKVRIKSKEWYSKNEKNHMGNIVLGELLFTRSMTNHCGQIANITYVDSNSTYYLIDLDNGCWKWTDEMFEDEVPHLLLENIANVIKSHNMGIQVSEQDGKLIIEPLKVDEDDLPIDTPVMAADANSVDTFILRYYAGKGEVFSTGHPDAETEDTCHYDIIIPWDKFDPKDLGESMKFNIVK